METPISKDIINAMPWGVIVFNAQMAVVYSNDAAHGILNWNTSDNEHTILQTSWVDINGKPLTIEDHPIRNCFRNGQTVNKAVLGVSFRTKPGVTWLEAHCIPEFEKGEKLPIRVCFTFTKAAPPHATSPTNKSDKESAAPPMQNGFSYESDILNRIGQSVIVTDLKGAILYTNDAASRIYGWTKEEFLKKNVVDTTLPEESLAQANGIMEKLSNGESWSGEFFVRRKNGTIFPAFVTDSPLYNEQGELFGIIAISSDITDQKNQNNALRHSQMLLNETGKIAKVGGWELDCTNMQQEWTDETYTIHDREKEKYNPNSTEELSRFEPGSKELIEAAFEAALTKGEPYDLEVEMTTVKGNRKWVRAVCSPVIANGKVTKLSGILQDITERKHAETVLLESEARFSTLFKLNPSPVGITNATDYRIIDVNEAWCKLSGYAREDVVGQTTTELALTDSHTLSQIRKILKEHNRVAPLEITLFTRSGRERHVVMSTDLIELNGESFFINTFLDVTELKQADRNRSIALTKYKALFDNFPMGITVSDKAGNIIESNATAEKMLGISAEEQKRKQLNGEQWQIVRPDGTPMSHEEYAGARALREGQKVENVEMGIVQPDKSISWINVTAAPVPLEDYGVVVTYNDITQRKLAEEKLKENQVLLKQVLDSEPDAIFAADINYNLLINNKQHQQILVATGGRQLNIGDNVLHSDYQPEAIEFWKGLFNRAFTGEEFKIEMEWAYSDGQIHIMESNFSPLRDTSEKITGALVVVHDITTRRLFEKKLMESEERLSLFIQHAPASLAMFDRDMRYLAVSNKWLTDSLISENDIIGRHHYEVVPEISDEWKATHQRGMNGEYIKSDDDKFVRRDGSIQYLKWEVRPWFNAESKVGGIIIITEDITESKESENKLRESEKRFVTIFEDSPLPIAISRMSDQKIILANTSMTRFLGYSHEEIIGNTTSSLGICDDLTDRRRFFEKIKKHQRVAEMETIVKLKSGETRQVVVWGEPIELSGDSCVMVEVMDITARKLAEQQLKEREAELNQAQELAKMANWRVNLSTYEHQVSANYRKLFDIDDSVEITFDYFLSRVHPDDVDLMRMDRYTFSKDMPPLVYDFRVLMKDGSLKWIQSVMIPEFIGERLVALKGTNIDITDKKNREEEIRKHNEKLQAILNALPDKLFVHDATGNFLEAYTTDPGGFIIPLEQFIGKNLRDIFPKEIAELNIKYLNECLTKHTIVTHEFSTDYKGAYSHFEVRVVPFMEDKVIRFVRDITERKEIEKQIIKLNKAIEQSPVAIVITDKTANITYASRAFTEITGYTKDEVIGKNTRILKSGKNEHETYHKLWKTITSGEVWEGELINKRKDGTFYWEHLTITPLYENENLITGYMAVKQDITEKKKNQQEILFLNTSLERKVEERTLELKLTNEELVRAKEAAEEANKAKSIFLANMSHEIRTPLNSIIGFAELLYHSLGNEKTRSQLDAIRRSGKNLLNIINDILDLSKVEAGKKIIEKEPVDLFQIVREVGVMFEQKAIEKQLSLTIEANTDLPTPLLLDETRLRQILFNLIGNAIKFTNKGCVTVLLEHIRTNNNLLDLKVKIKDTGVGIAHDQLDAIFEPFVQQQGQAQKTYGGTGLGLAISRRLAQAMGGEIEATSELNKGSEFTVHLKNVLKATPSEKLKDRNEIHYQSANFMGFSVLIVDDIADNRKLLFDVLTPTGARLLQAENGAEAVQLATLEKPDIVLMDIRMPVMDGMEACKAIKTTPATAHIPCVAVSASIKLGNPKNKIPENFDEYILKPVVLDQLFDILFKYLKPNRVNINTPTVTANAVASDEPEKEWPKELKLFAENELLPKYHRIMKTQLVDEMEDYGKQLIATGQRFNVVLLANLGRKLIEYADIFDVDRLIQTMHEFESVTTRHIN